MEEHTLLGDHYFPIWRCLENTSPSKTATGLRSEVEGSYGPTHPDIDVISLRRVTGVNINKLHEQTPCTLSVTTLDSRSVKQWLQRCSTRLSLDRGSCLSLLICDQVLRNDGLRPPLSLSETHISKSFLSGCIHLPKIAIEKLGQEAAYTVTYPPPANGDANISCHTVVSEACSASWSYDSSTGTTNAIIILRQTERIALRERILRTLDALKDFSTLPTLIPYILLESTVNSATPVITTHDRDLISDQVHVLSGFRRKQPVEIFGSATLRTDSIFDVLKHANSILTMSKQASTSTLLSRPHNTSDAAWSQMTSHHHSLNQLIEFRQQELTHLISNANYLRQKSEALRSALTGLISFNHQETTQEIAQRSKEDGTAMKTLAVLAAVYLPSTAIATIMSMPIFTPDSTNSSNNDYNNYAITPRLQIFLAISVPLTIATMLTFYLWCHLENSDRPSRSRFGFGFRSRSRSFREKIMKCPFTGRQAGEKMV